MSAHLHPLPAATEDFGADPGIIRVILADDHPSLRRSLTSLVNCEPDLRVVGEADDLPAALRQLGSSHAQVVVLDLRIPNEPGESAIEAMHRQRPGIGIVIITMHDSRGFAQHALKAGALGFVLKDSADTDLPEAIRCAARGASYVSPRVH